MGHAAVFYLYSCVPRRNELFLVVRPTVSFLRLAATRLCRTGGMHGALEQNGLVLKILSIVIDLQKIQICSRSTIPGLCP